MFCSGVPRGLVEAEEQSARRLGLGFATLWTSRAELLDKSRSVCHEALTNLCNVSRTLEQPVRTPKKPGC